jgi:ATP-dependent DNA ligase
MVKKSSKSKKNNLKSQQTKISKRSRYSNRQIKKAHKKKYEEDEEYNIENFNDEDCSEQDEEEKSIYYPMLAKDFHKYSKSIEFPCYVQPKLDGVRAIFHKNKLWSRNGNKFHYLNHIKDELKTDMILDGELFSIEMPFEELVGLVKRQKISEEEKLKSKKIKYMVFDIITKDSYEIRKRKLEKFILTNNPKNTVIIQTDKCERLEDVDKFLEKYLSKKYEGIIIRNIKGKYTQNSRSSDLQKLKRFQDEEFEIIDFTCGTGKEKNCIIWMCKTKDGKEFSVRPEGTYEERKKLFKDGEKYVGKLLTVKFQTFTNVGIPRFPVAVTIRDYE